MVRQIKRFVFRTTIGPADIAVLLLGLFLAARMAWPVIMPAELWITLRSVHVADAVTGQPIMVTAHRTIHRDALGDYEVDIREAATGKAICYARQIGRPYRVPEDGSTVITRPLRTWWAMSDDRACVEWVPQPGAYFVSTRHCWRPVEFMPRVCNDWVDSPTFHIWPRPAGQ